PGNRDGHRTPFLSYADSLQLSSAGAAKGLNIATPYRTIDFMVYMLVIDAGPRDGSLDSAYVCRHTSICLRFRWDIGDSEHRLRLDASAGLHDPPPVWCRSDIGQAPVYLGNDRDRESTTRPDR